jgi:hypothetical protein
MRANQLTRGQRRRVLYVENKDGDLDGAAARIGWVTFSKSGLSVRYRGRLLQRLGGAGVRGNFVDEATGEEFWVSAIKRDGSNRHRAERGTRVAIDADAAEELELLRAR